MVYDFGAQISKDMLLKINEDELLEKHARATLEVIERHIQAGLSANLCRETLSGIKKLLKRPEFK